MRYTLEHIELWSLAGANNNNNKKKMTLRKWKISVRVEICLDPKRKCRHDIRYYLWDGSFPKSLSPSEEENDRNMEIQVQKVVKSPLEWLRSTGPKKVFMIRIDELETVGMIYAIRNWWQAQFIF